MANVEKVRLPYLELSLRMNLRRERDRIFAFTSASRLFWQENPASSLVAHALRGSRGSAWDG